MHKAPAYRSRPMCGRPKAKIHEAAQDVQPQAAASSGEQLSMLPCTHVQLQMLCSQLELAPLDVFQRLDFVLQRKRDVMRLCHRHVTCRNLRSQCVVAKNVSCCVQRYCLSTCCTGFEAHASRSADEYAGQLPTWHHNLHLHDIACAKMIAAEGRNSQ